METGESLVDYYEADWFVHQIQPASPSSSETRAFEFFYVTTIHNNGLEHFLNWVTKREQATLAKLAAPPTFSHPVTLYEQR